jgi:hypothetical protein
MSDNPWLDRFEGLESAKTIIQRMEFIPKPILGLRFLDPAAAAVELDQALKSLFLVSGQILALVLKVIPQLIHHARTNYPSRKAFLARCYSSVEVEPYLPLCLTGLAGTGKTSLFDAFRRLLALDTEILVDVAHTFRLCTVRSVKVRSQVSIPQMLSILSDGDSSRIPLAKVGSRSSPDSHAHRLYQDGVCQVLADEFQFLTQSQTANTQIAKNLLALTYLGLHAMFNANYSLLHRLKKRPQEEQHRLLGNVVQLVPDPPGSDDWIRLLREFEKLAPDFFKIDFETERQAIWNYCAGLRRNLRRLLVIATQHREGGHGGFLTMSSVRAAFLSGEYAMYREEVALLIQSSITGVPPKNRPDLTCPIDFPEAATAGLRDALRKARQQAVTDAVVDSSLTDRERQVKESLEKSLPDRETPPPRNTKTSPKKTADSLIDAHNRFGRSTP